MGPGISAQFKFFSLLISAVAVIASPFAFATPLRCSSLTSGSKIVRAFDMETRDSVESLPFSRDVKSAMSQLASHPTNLANHQALAVGLQGFLKQEKNLDSEVSCSQDSENPECQVIVIPPKRSGASGWLGDMTARLYEDEVLPVRIAFSTSYALKRVAYFHGYLTPARIDLDWENLFSPALTPLGGHEVKHWRFKKIGVLSQTLQFNQVFNFFNSKSTLLPIFIQGWPKHLDMSDPQSNSLYGSEVGHVIEEIDTNFYYASRFHLYIDLFAHSNLPPLSQRLQKGLWKALTALDISQGLTRIDIQTMTLALQELENSGLQWEYSADTNIVVHVQKNGTRIEVPLYILGDFTLLKNQQKLKAQLKLILRGTLTAFQQRERRNFDFLNQLQSLNVLDSGLWNIWMKSLPELKQLQKHPPHF